MESLLLSAKLRRQVQVLAIDDDTQLLSVCLAGWPLACCLNWSFQSPSRDMTTHVLFLP
jgi:hypothetical protein